MTNMQKQRRTDSERGSALLIVFVMAAIIAIMLYNEMPIAVFEAQRQKEQLLIDRGNEYVHAVRLFVRANRGQYPANMEALENTNRVRYLRSRYKDPFTGKDDWRLLHAGPNGIIIDSKLKPATVGLNNGNGNNNNGNNNNGVAGQNNNIGASPFGNSAGSGGFGNNVTAGANASFSGFGSSPSNAGIGAGQQQQQQGNQNANSAFGGGFGRNAGFGSNTNATGSGNQQSSFGGFYSQPTTATATQAGGQTQTSQTSTNTDGSGRNGSDNPISVAAQRAPAIASGTVAQPDQQAEGDEASEGGTPAVIPRSRRPTAGEFEANSSGQRATETADVAGQAQSNNGAAAGVGPGPGGFGRNATGLANTGGAGGGPGGGPGGPAVNRGGFTAFSNTNSFGANSSSSSQLGGIQNASLAGVASKAGGLSIKLVNDQDNYALWEFYYDPTKDPMRGALGVQGGGGANTQAGNTGGPAGVNNPGNNGFGNSNSTFGNGQNAGFGNSQGNGFGNNQNRGVGGSNSFGSGGGSGFGSGFSGFNSTGSSNSTAGTSSQAPVPRSSPMNQTMSTSSQP